jgi:glycosyltransferase involved in cell wall biosynthesis
MENSSTYFIGGILPKSNYIDVKKGSQTAAETLQQAYINCLKSRPNFSFISLPFVGSSPFYYKKLCCQPQIKYHDSPRTVNLGFINIFFIKKISRFFVLKKQLISEISSTNNNLIFVAYSLDISFILALVVIKKKYKNIKVCFIVPDLIQHMSSIDNFIFNLYKKIEIKLLEKSIKYIDSFVFLTEQMSELCYFKNKKSIVIEGIYSDIHTTSWVPEKILNKKIVLYTGSVEKRYGIVTLLEAFKRISVSDYELWICGVGNGISIIEEFMKQDKRIKYFAQISRDQVLILQKQATVLVNPRCSEGDYTLYSFPSKTMEYLASGTVTIMNRLPGIPIEYFNYVYVPKDESTNSLKDAILDVCEQSFEERVEFGIKARDFILNNKSVFQQGEKLNQFINSL